MRHTRRDHGNHCTLAALAHLAAAQDCRQRYDQLLQGAIARYGDTQRAAISGIYADHFPEETKDQLRFYARLIGIQVDHAVELWRKAGRKRDTLRGYLREARRLEDGRESYY